MTQPRKHPSVFDYIFGGILDQLDRIEKRIETMAIDQATFDTDLAALVTSIGTLTAAVDEWMAAHPDLTAEDQTVQDAAAAVQAELAKLAPPTP